MATLFELGCWAPDKLFAFHRHLANLPSFKAINNLGLRIHHSLPGVSGIPINPIL